MFDVSDDRNLRVGSLLLGNKALPPDAVLDADQIKYKEQWKITIDRMTRYREELADAEEMLKTVKKMDYNKLRQEGARKKGSVADIEGKRPIANQLKNDLIKSRKQGEDGQINDIFEGKTAEEKDQLVLG